QPRLVERPDLFEGNEAIITGELDGNAKSCRAAASRHRGDDRYIEKIVDLRRRNDHAGTSLADFPAASWIELRQPHLSSLHHFKSSSASLPNSGHTSRPFPAAATALLSSAHPWRGRFLIGAMQILPPCTGMSRRPTTLTVVLVAAGLLGWLVLCERPRFA